MYFRPVQTQGSWNTYFYLDFDKLAIDIYTDTITFDSCGKAALHASVCTASGGTHPHNCHPGNEVDAFFSF